MGGGERVSFLKGFLLWMNERFPAPTMIMSVVIYFLGAKYGQFLYAESGVTLGWIDAAGAVVLIALFLLIRVLDEHKDYELDKANYPERVLQRGLITLGQLKAVGVICLVFQVGFSLWLGKGMGPVLFWWGVMMLWLFLMTMEFFCGEWLEERLFLYAFSHMLIMPLIGLWAVQMGAVGHTVDRSAAPILLILFFFGFTAEIARKTRGPEEERDTVLSYSQIFGTRGSAGVVFLLMCVSLGLMGWVIQQVSGTWKNGYGAALLVAGILGTLCLASFLAKPSLKGRKLNEVGVGGGLLIGCITVIVCLVRQGGF